VGAAPLLAVLLTAGSASAGPAVPVDQCRVTDERLSGLSGLASDGEHWYAINDHDDGVVSVYVLDRNCRVQRTITAPIDPFDVEDLALAPDGTLWLADTGDNRRIRETVALHTVSPSGGARRFRLTYPDGKHDAEAILFDRKGTPYVITKEPIGSALVYRPVGELSEQSPTPLEKVASVSIRSTDTPGGPVAGSIGSRVVTGAAVSADGSVVALRTYNDAYLFPVPNGDLPAALTSDPVRVPLPDEPQGEAIAFEPDGTLISGSEFGQGASSGIRAVAGAAALATPKPPAPAPVPTTTPLLPTPAPQQDNSSKPWPAVAGVVVTSALVVLFSRRLRRRR
jgi:hypothetical protein